MADRLRVRGTGFDYRPHRFAPMPAKVPGKHRWIVVAMHHVSAESLKASRRGEDVHLDMENLVGLKAGCFDCEQEWPAPEPCPAGDEWGDGR